MKSKQFSRPGFKMWLVGRGGAISCKCMQPWKKNPKNTETFKQWSCHFLRYLDEIFSPSNNSQQYIGYWIKVNNSCQSSSCYTSEGCIQSCAFVALHVFFFFLSVCPVISPNMWNATGGCGLYAKLSAGYLSWQVECCDIYLNYPACNWGKLYADHHL